MEGNCQWNINNALRERDRVQHVMGSVEWNPELTVWIPRFHNEIVSRDTTGHAVLF